MDVVETIGCTGRGGSRARLKDYWDLTKPRMNGVVLLTTITGYFFAARESTAWNCIIPTVLGTGSAAAGASVLNQLMEYRFER